LSQSETYGIESGYGEKVVEWINTQAKKKRWKLESRLYDYKITTKNFGEFEMFSWIGDVKAARDLVKKASKRFKIRVIEGGYRTKEKIIKREKSDYAIVIKGDKILGHLEFSASRLANKKWELREEERK